MSQTKKLERNRLKGDRLEGKRLEGKCRALKASAH